MAATFSVFNKFKAIDETTKPVKRMTKSVDRFGTRSQQAFKRADRGAGRLTSKLRSLAAIAATLIGVTAIVQQLSSAVMIGAEFEQTIVNASAKFGDSARKGTRQFKLLNDAARQVGATTEFTASQAAEGLNFLALAGFDATQAVAALPGVIDLATAAQVELGTATDIATDALGSFGLQTSNAEQLQKNLNRVTDVFAKTTTSSNTNMVQLFEAMKEGGPVATSLGASIETVAAMAGRLADAGKKSSDAGTILKNVFLSLSATTPKAEKQLSRLGIKLADSKGNFRDMFDILQDLNGALEGMGDVERAGVLKDIFGKIPIAGVNILLKTGTDNLRAFRTELENAGGATKKMAAAMRDTRLAQFKTLLSALESVKISFFVAIDNVLGNVTGSLIEVTRATDLWITKNQFLIQNVLQTLLGVLGSIGTIFGEVIRIVGDANDLFGGMLVPGILGVIGALKAWAVIQGVINLLLTANPIGLAVVALVALAAGIKAVIDNWQFLVEDFKAGFKIFMDINLAPLRKMVDVLQKGKEVIKSFFGRFFGEPDEPQARRGSRGGAVPLSGPGVIARSMHEEKQNNSVDINFNNMPDGATVAGSGGPGVRLNTGYSGEF